MKILVLHWGRKGGGPQFSFEMAQALAKMEDVEVLTSYARGCDNEEDWRSLNVSSLVVDTYESIWSLSFGWHRWFRAGLALRKFIVENQVDVVYSGMLSIWQSFALPFAVPKSAIYAASIHDGIEHPGDFHLVKFLCRKLEIAHADIVVTYSDHVRDLVRSQLRRSRPVVALRHGANAREAIGRSLMAGRPTVIGFFGRLAAYKGLELYVDSIIKLNKDGYSIRGAVYGQGQVKTSLIESSSSFIDWNIGWIDGSDFNAIFDRFDVLALPYIEASQSGVFSQAIGRGVPVVATPVGGLTQQVAESSAGLISSGISSASFSQRLRDLVEDQTLYRSLSLAGIEAAKGNLSWEATARSLVDSIDSQTRLGEIE